MLVWSGIRGIKKHFEPSGDAGEKRGGGEAVMNYSSGFDRLQIEIGESQGDGVVV